MKKIGFVFSGEGAKGAIQSGIALGLYRRGIKPHYLTGVSSGALNSIGFCYLQPDGLAEMWSGIDSIFRVFSPNWMLWRDSSALLTPTPLIKMIRERLSSRGHVICEAEFPVVDLITGKEHWLKHDVVRDHPEMLAAAGCIMGLVTPIEGRFVDAYSRVLCPLKAAIQNDCDEIYVILGRPMDYPPLKKKPSNPLAAAFRAIELSMHEIILRDIKMCLDANHRPGKKMISVWVADPARLIYDALDFSSCERGVRYGMTNYVLRKL